MRVRALRHLAVPSCLAASGLLLAHALLDGGPDGPSAAARAAVAAAPTPFIARLAAAPAFASFALEFDSAHADISYSFGPLNIPPGRFGMLPKWRNVLRMARLEAPRLDRCAADKAACETNALRAWRRMLRRAESLEPMARLDSVNRFFNVWPYREDRTKYGKADRWVSPVEFMKRSGDCEDFAIAKFFTLRRLGVANRDMRIVTVYDERRRIGHAVLLVRHGDDLLVLDNLGNRIMSHREYRHYVPRHSFNETAEFAYHDSRNRIPLSAVLAALGGKRG